MNGITTKVTPLALAFTLAFTFGILPGCTSEPAVTGSSGGSGFLESDGESVAQGSLGADASAGADTARDDRVAGLGVLDSFEAQDLDGNPVDQSIFANSKLTMVNIWGTFCGPCIGEMPDLGELAGMYDASEFQIVGIVCDACDLDGDVSPSVVSTAKEIIESTGASYTHLVPTGELWDALFSVQYVPTTVFVDSEGYLVGDMQVGSKAKGQWKTLIDNYLTLV